MITRSGASVNLNNSKNKTPTITPRPTITSVNSAVIGLEKKYTNILAKFDEILTLKNRIADVETENQKLNERVIDLENENAQLKSQLSGLKQITDDVQSNNNNTNDSPIFPLPTFDIEGNVVVSTDLINNQCQNQPTNLVSRQDSIVDSLSKTDVCVIDIIPSNSSLHTTTPIVSSEQTPTASSSAFNSLPTPTLNVTVNPASFASTPVADRPNHTPKWKWLHLSSIVTLTPEIIKIYVSKKLKNCPVKCFRLAFRNSKTFKVGVPFGTGNELWNNSFWPIGTIVRDFHVRRNFRMHRHMQAVS